MGKVRVIWTRSALNELRNIYDYYLENVGHQMAENIRTNVLMATGQLSSEPRSGIPEPSLSNEAKQYRSVIRGHYKVIYRMEGDSVMVVDVFDTRQDPPKIKRHA
ncbi:MAG: hypothetical protein RL266_801 [Bacteroidota bacterium]|jgi:plasmid stabilization system protein ParE